MSRIRPRSLPVIVPEVRLRPRGLCETASAKGKGRKGKRLRLGSMELRGRSTGLRLQGPGHVRFRRREDRAEDPDAAADRAGLAAVVDQDDADHTGYDGSAQQFLPPDRGGRPQGTAEYEAAAGRRRLRG